MPSARTSNSELAATCQALGLEVKLDAAAPDGAEELADALVEVYSDPALAEAARVFVFREGDEASLAAVLSRWAQRDLPELSEADELVEFAADWLSAKAVHGDAASPQLIQLYASEATLYLLRSDTASPGKEWMPGFDAGTCESPGMHPALEGVYRDGGCSPAFAEHAQGCARCEVLFEEHRQRQAKLPPGEQYWPEGFEAFLKPAPPQVHAPPQVSAPSPQTKPWWKIW